MTIETTPAVFPGKIVHYALDPTDTGGDPSLTGQTRAAFIIRAIGTPDTSGGMVNLAVLLDGTNDSPNLPYPGTLLRWIEAVPFDANGTPGTWREAV